MRRIYVLATLAVLAVTANFDRARAASLDRPLWGDLKGGPYAVGFRSIYVLDPSREWRNTRPYGRPFQADRSGRPIRFDLWYPARSVRGGNMTYAGYINSPPADPVFSDYYAHVHSRDALLAKLSVAENDPRQLQRLYGTSVPARRNAPPASGRFPVVFWIGGQNDSLQTGSILAEYLASRGYVVAAVALGGRTEEQSDLTRRPPDTETTLRDTDFAWSQLRHNSMIDPTHVAVIGYSWGAVEAVLLAARNPDVTAIIGLDGSYGFEGPPESGSAASLKAFYDYDPTRIRASLLDIRRDILKPPLKFDFSEIDGMTYSNRYRITLARMHHSDFSTFAMLGPRYGISTERDADDVAQGWNRRTGAEGFQAVCRIVGQFLDYQLKRSATAELEFRRVAHAAPADQFVVQAALPAPPSTNDYVRLIRDRGLNATIALASQLRSSAPRGAAILDWAQLNNLGYDLLGQEKVAEALGIFRLTAGVFPTYADAADSLGDGYLAAGDKIHAREAYEHAAVLVATDDRYKAAEDKKSFADAERAKAKKL